MQYIKIVIFYKQNVKESKKTKPYSSAGA